MSQQELLKKVLQILDSIQVNFMITGSIASSLQGEPRSTNDMDIVIDLPQNKVSGFLAAFPLPDYCLDKESICRALKEQGAFNLIESKHGDKIDFWILTDDLFDRSRFARRVNEEFMGVRFEVSSPEDTILMKLKWAKLSGGSEKQFVDALRVYEVQYGKLDIDYIEKWVRTLAIEELWKSLTQEAEIV
jgi:hypothetical protein